MDQAEQRQPRPAVFVSPHLDDAALSAAALISHLRMERPVWVLTVFTHAGQGPHGRAARSYLSQCAVPNAEDLYRLRREEDAAVMRQLGVQWRHLGHTDALFRKRAWAARGMGARLARRIPDVAQRYPTYRFDIARGRISGPDRELVTVLADELRARFRELRPWAVFGPMGIGLHTDHMITRDAVLLARPGAVLWADQPYLERRSPAPAAAVTAGRPHWTWEDGLRRKADVLRCYETQIQALFTHGDVPDLVEHFYGSTPR